MHFFFVKMFACFFIKCVFLPHSLLPFRKNVTQNAQFILNGLTWSYTLDRSDILDADPTLETVAYGNSGCIWFLGNSHFFCVLWNHETQGHVVHLFSTEELLVHEWNENKIIESRVITVKTDFLWTHFDIKWSNLTLKWAHLPVS